MSGGAGLILSEQTLDALRYIHQYRYLTKDHVAAATDIKPKTASEMLLRLERHRLLSSFGNVPIAGKGKTPKVYYLTKRGHALLAEEFGEIAPYRAVNVTSRWSPKMAHKLATLDVLMALERGVHDRPHYALPATFLEYRRDRIGERWTLETMDYVAAPETAENKIIPDAGFILENIAKNSKALFLIEVDLGTERHVSRSGAYIRESVRHKISQYDRYLSGARFKKRYASWGDFPYFVLLVITNSEQRLSNMRTALSDLDANFHQYFRFSTLKAVKTNFFHHAWRGRAISDERQYGLIAGGKND